MFRNKWVIRILIGFGALFAAWVIVALILFVVTLSRIPALIRQADQAAGLNSPNFKAALSIAIRARDQKSLTDGDMITLEQLSKDPHWAVRCEALDALFNLGNTSQAKRAATIAHAKLNDPDRSVREFALEALAWLKAPDAQTIARRMLNDPSAGVRKQAQKMVPQRTFSITDNSHPY